MTDALGLAMSIVFPLLGWSLALRSD